MWSLHDLYYIFVCTLYYTFFQPNWQIEMEANWKIVFKTHNSELWHPFVPVALTMPSLTKIFRSLLISKWSRLFPEIEREWQNCKPTSTWLSINVQARKTNQRSQLWIISSSAGRTCCCPNNMLNRLGFLICFTNPDSMEEWLL